MKKEINVSMEDVLKEVLEKMGHGFQVEIRKTVKNNGIIRRRIVISDGISAISPCIDLDVYYEMYQEPEDIPIIAQDIVKVYQTCRREEDFPVQDFMEWENVRHKLLFRLVNTQKNVGLLQDMPHQDLPELGLSVTFYILLYTDEGKAASIQIHNEHMDMWDVTVPDLLEYAGKNTPAIMRLCVDSMEDILYKTMEKEMDRIGEMQKRFSVYVMTNEQKLYGAGSILYSGALEKAAEKIGSGFYVLPSSVHEVILLPSDGQDSGSLESLKEMVSEINGLSDLLPPEDVLSDNVYYYDKEVNELTIVA